MLFQAARTLSDPEKVRVGDEMLNIRKPRGRPRRPPPATTTITATPSSTSPSGRSSKEYDDQSVSSYSSDASSGRGNAFNSSPSSSNGTTISTTNSLSASSAAHSQQTAEIGGKRKSPSTNLRRYAPAEVELIRKLTVENPEANTKALFHRFRRQFPAWNDDTESYTKFYQKKWRIGKEEEMRQHRLLESLAKGRKRPLGEDAKSERAINPPKRAKVHHVGASSLTAPPPQVMPPTVSARARNHRNDGIGTLSMMNRGRNTLSVSSRNMECKAGGAENEREDHSLIPPLPPPPSITQITSRGRGRY